MSFRSRGPAACLVALAVVSLSLSGCGSQDKTVTVLAASSLTGTFTTLADQFEKDHPGVQVKLAFDSSATLAQQAHGRCQVHGDGVPLLGGPAGRDR